MLVTFTHLDATDSHISCDTLNTFFTKPYKGNEYLNLNIHKGVVISNFLLGTSGALLILSWEKSALALYPIIIFILMLTILVRVIVLACELLV
jgi:hypothetical protein